MRVKGAQAGVLITEYHPEGESATIQLRIDQIDTSPGGPKAGREAKASAPRSVV